MDMRRRERGTEKRLERRPQREAHRSDGGRTDQQGLNFKFLDSDGPPSLAGFTGSGKIDTLHES